MANSRNPQGCETSGSTMVTARRTEGRFKPVTALPVQAADVLADVDHDLSAPRPAGVGGTAALPQAQVHRIAMPPLMPLPDARVARRLARDEVDLESQHVAEVAGRARHVAHGQHRLNAVELVPRAEVGLGRRAILNRRHGEGWRSVRR